ncbi:MAG: murein biosynthesis integral membrane protein MurJ [Kofleriaceae bacterium]
MNPKPAGALSKLSRLLRGSGGRELIPAALKVGSCALTVKALAAGKELLVAYRFGTSAELDAYLFAYLFPAFLINILSGSLQSAFVPKLLAAQVAADHDRASRLVGAASVVVLGLLICVALVTLPIAVAAIPRLARGFDGATIDSCQTLVMWLMPLLVLNGLAGFWTGVLNAQRRLVYAALVPATTPLVVAASLWLLWDESGILAVVIGMYVGAAVELWLTMSGLRSTGVRLFAGLRGLAADFRALVSQFWPAAGANALMSTTTMIDQVFAAALTSGSVAALAYGTRITGVVSSVMVMAISTVTLPFFSRLAAEADLPALKRGLKVSALLVLAFGLPAAILIATSSQAIIATFYERGAFSAEDTQLVSSIQVWHALQIPVYALSIVAVRFIAAMSATRILLLGAAVNVLTDLAFNAWLTPRIGVPGVAIANVAMYTVSCVFLWSAAIWRLRTAAP